jgi:hypothetical protein
MVSLEEKCHVSLVGTSIVALANARASSLICPKCYVVIFYLIS